MLLSGLFFDRVRFSIRSKDGYNSLPVESRLGNSPAPTFNWGRVSADVRFRSSG